MIKEINVFRKLIVVLFLLTIIKLSERIFEINLPLLRYILVISATYFLLFKIIKIHESLKYRYQGMSKIFVILIVIFTFFSIITGIPELADSSKNYIKLKQFIGEKILLFCFPLLLFIRPNPHYWRPFIKYIYLLLIFLIPFLLLDLAPYLTREKSPEGLIRATAGASGFLLLISAYFKNRKKNFILSIYLISLLLMLYHARRNMVLYFGSFIIFYYYLSFFSKTVILKVSRWKTVLNTFVLGIIGSILFLFSNPDFSLFFERAETGFESREEILNEFFFQMNPGTFDFYIGRGMFGEFYSNTLGTDQYGELGAGMRDVIENGYLQLILNFGFIFVFCFTLLSLIGFYYGFFKSKNILAKACGSILLINLIDMIGFGVPELNYRYLVIFLSIPFLFDRQFRNLSDLEISKILKLQ